MSSSQWTLFLDRDGVVNERLPGAYISDWKDFHFTAGALEAIAQFSSLFARIIIVTNQQGIGKGWMTETQLQAIHTRMKQEIVANKGRIDGIYYCPDLATKEDHCRKPRPALALAAQRDFPDIAFPHSIMVGDSISDIEFGQQLGMRTVLINTKFDEQEQWTGARARGLIPDLSLNSLASLTGHLPSFLR